jgi:hypothetical protein
MGAQTQPIPQWSGVSMRRMGLRKRPSQGEVHSAIHAVELCHVSRIIPTYSCMRKSQNLKNLTINPSVLIKSLSMIMTVSVKAPTHPELMVTGAWGN